MRDPEYSFGMATKTLPKAKFEAFQFVFILGVGRSGTTVLQNVLNSVPKVCIRGENGGAIWPLAETYSLVQRSVEGDGRWARDHPGDPWFGLSGVSLSGLAGALRRSFVTEVLQPPLGAQFVGFKEIRFPSRGLVEAVTWVNELFPGARFVLNFREPAAIAKSGWGRDSPRSRTHISRRQRDLARLATFLGDTGFSVQYESFHSTENERKKLFAWLNMDYQADRVDAVLSTRLHHLQSDSNR